MNHREVKISGFGGQGIIFAGYIIGKAAAIYDHRYATMVQSYGPEARGGACGAQVIIADTPIHYPYAIEPELLIAMSQEAYTKFVRELKPGGVLLIDEDLVTTDSVRDDVQAYRVPATKIAEGLGHRIVANVVMLGFLAAVAQIVSADAVKEALVSSLPAGSTELNQKAFKAGYEWGQRVEEYRWEVR
ncbi:MAG: 2-oxoacid:acceptor oxidoreductase family protein [Acidobacteria bacterium]|nr:2-oxoacid:acceptor oxidoreductase family protein [Acidobacteriota bacterium]